MLARLARLVAVFWALGVSAPAGAKAGKAPPIAPKLAAKIKVVEQQVLSTYRAGKTIVTPLKLKLLKLHQKAWGKTSPHLAPVSFDLASALMGEMRYTEAQTHYERAAAWFEQLHGPKHERVATALQMIAVIHFVVRDYASADRYMRRSTQIREELYGVESVMYATYLQVWASMLQGQHSYQKAEDLLRRAVTIIEKLKGPRDVMLTNGLMQLGWLYYRRGNFRQGDAAYLRAIDIQSKAPGSQPGTIAQHWVTVGRLNHGLGRRDKANVYFERAERSFDGDIERLSRRYGVESPEVDRLKLSLADLFMATGRLNEAKAILLALRKKAKTPLMAVAHNWKLGLIAAEQRRFDDAIGYYRAIIASYKGTLGAAAALGPTSMIAHTYRVKGQYNKALKYIAKARAAYRASFGDDHPITVTQMEAEALVRVLMGQMDRGLKMLTTAQTLLEPHTANVLASGTEADNRQYLASIAYQLDNALTIHRTRARDNRGATRLALSMILQRKGRVLEAVADIFGAMRRRMTPTDRKLLDQLRLARTTLSRLVIGGPGKRTPAVYQREVSAAATAVRRLEGMVRSRNAVYKAFTMPVTIAAVAKAIPKGAALVEFIAYRQIDLQGRTYLSRDDVEHYAAYILDSDGRIASVDLGPRKVLDAAIAQLRAALADPNRDDVRALAQKAYTLAFKPVAAALGKTRHVILSPDGGTNLLPFAALVDERGQFLLSRYLFSYVTSGRDLVRSGPSVKARGPSTIIANPNFDGAGVAPGSTVPGGVPPDGTRGRVARALRTTRWKQLPGTGLEAAAVAKVLSDAVVKTGEEATEGALKTVQSPRILHVATHGFFLPSDKKRASSTTVGALPSAPMGFGGLTASASRAGNNRTTAENPLLRSGLALGGANALRSGAEDGVLTALIGPRVATVRRE